MIIKKAYTISSIDKVTPGVTIFSFKATDGSVLDFEPGMFVMLYYRDQLGAEIGRAFSIANEPNSTELQFAISMIHGKFTSKLDSAKIGDTYYISGPHGQFKINPNDKKTLFLAGGTGIAPFLSIFLHAEKLKLDMNPVLIYSVRYPSEIIKKERLDEFRESIGLSTVVTVTRPQEGDNWSAEKGHIDAKMIKKYVSDVTERSCYICGPLAFAKGMMQALIDLGVDKAKIKADVWGE